MTLVAEEEKILNYFTLLTTEPGVHGGVGTNGHDKGPAKNYDVMLDMIGKLHNFSENVVIF